MYKRILVATDGSALSDKAAGNAIQLAATLGAEAITLNIMSNYPQSYFEGSITLMPEEVARVEKRWTNEGHAIVEKVKKWAKHKMSSLNP